MDKSRIHELLGIKLTEEKSDTLRICDLSKILVNMRIRKGDVIPLAKELEKIGSIRIESNGRINSKTKIKILDKTK